MDTIKVTSYSTGFCTCVYEVQKIETPGGRFAIEEGPFALHSNYSFEIVILVMFLKHCQNLFSFALLIMPTALSGGGRGGGLVKCSLTFKVGYLVKRGAYFETRRNYNIPFLISKSENVISCQ